MRQLRLRVRELMEQKEKELGRSIRQMEICEIANIPQGTFSRYVNGHLHRYDKEILEKLCDYFNCGIEDLLALEDDK